ncbi:4'-phosphopantetheinyl transferase superfamily [Lipomyces orientalis]|uniref:4'-phosphopantetheinyl transferase superfamily n=1 Tax=Lipomyces orientalis TaxID=1233043 RepID=A0ACC3TZI8_9ASCO
MSVARSISLTQAAISKASIANIRGVGIDLVHVPRIAALLSRKPAYLAKFTRRVLHENEYNRAVSMIENRERHNLFIARCWSIKEALFKSLDESRQSGFQMRDWNTIHASSPKPIVSGGLIRNDEDFFVSVTHDGEYVLAAVIRGQSDNPCDNKRKLL